MTDKERLEQKRLIEHFTNQVQLGKQYRELKLMFYCVDEEQFIRINENVLKSLIERYNNGVDA